MTLFPDKINQTLPGFEPGTPKTWGELFIKMKTPQNVIGLSFFGVLKKNYIIRTIDLFHNVIQKIPPSLNCIN